MKTRITNIFRSKSKIETGAGAGTEAITSYPVLQGIPEALQRSPTVDDLRHLLRPLMTDAGIPADQIDRLTLGSYDPLDMGKHQELLMATYGRLEHLQSIGSCAAALLTKKLALLNITPPVNPEINVSSLAAEGSFPIDGLLNEREISEILNWFKNRPCFNGHTPDAAHDRVQRYVGLGANEHVFGSYTTLDVVAAPHLLETMLSDKVLSCAAQHLGCVPTLSNFQAWWNFPNHQENNVPGNGVPCFYHRDLNDLRMFWVYMYLTDVDEESGPHMIIRQSSDIAMITQRLQRIIKDFPALRPELAALTARDFFYQYGYQIPKEAFETLFSDLEVSYAGNAGTAFFSNGFNFHRIKYPLQRTRLMFAARFSINPSINESPSRDGDPIPYDMISHRIGDTPLMRHVTRKIVDYRSR
jgi:hypothetical protein